jgi:uncharacterized protein (TIRG00374 family)
MGDSSSSKQKSSSSKWLHWVLSILILAGLSIAAFKYLNAQEVAEAFARFNWAYAAPILVLSALYLLFKALRFVVLCRPITDLPAGLLTRAYLAGQPATFVPGGVAVRAALLAQAGLPAGRTGGPIIYSSILDQLMFLLATLLAALWFPGARQVALISLAVVVLLAALLAVPQIRALASNALRALFKRFGHEQQWDHFLESLGGINNPLVLGLAVVWSAAAFIVPVVMFHLCLLGLGATPSFFVTLLAYTVPSMAGRLTILPGGVGVTEGGMIGMLQSLAGIDPNTGAAASALFRIGDSLFQGFLGGLVYLFFWKGRRESQHDAEHKVGSRGSRPDGKATAKPRKATS